MLWPLPLQHFQLLQRGAGFAEFIGASFAGLGGVFDALADGGDLLKKVKKGDRF